MTPETELMPAITKLRQTATPEVIKVLQLENLHDFDFLLSDYQEVLKAVHKVRFEKYAATGKQLPARPRNGL